MFWQISDTQHSVDQSRYRIEVLEKSLKMRKMPDEERTKLEQELEEVKKILIANESALRSLQLENRHTAGMAILVFAVCFAAYCLYSIYANPL